MAKNQFFDANGNPVPEEDVAAHPERFKITRYGDMPKAAPKVNATFKEPAKEPVVLPWLLAGGAGLAGYQIAQTIMDSIDEDGKKDKPMWRRLLSTLVPLGVAGASAYGGYRMGMPVKKAQSKEDRLASQEPIPVWNKATEDAEFGTPEDPVTPWGRYLKATGLGVGALGSGMYTKHQFGKYMDAPKHIGATSGEVSVASDRLKALRRQLADTEKFNAAAERANPQVAIDAQTHLNDINLRLQALGVGDPKRIPLQKEYEKWNKMFRENSIMKKDTRSILDEIAQNEKTLTASFPNPERSWRRFSGRPAKTLLGGLGTLGLGVGAASSVKDLWDFFSRRSNYHGLDRSELEQKTQSEVPVYSPEQFQQAGQGGN